MQTFATILILSACATAASYAADNDEFASAEYTADNNVVENSDSGFGVVDGSPLPAAGQYGRTLTRLEFDGSTFNAWNPNNTNSPVVFFNVEDRLDRGMFLDRGPGPTGVSMLTLPFTRWNDPRTGAAGALTAYEVELDLRDLVNITTGEVFTWSARVGCRSYNTHLFPYPKALVTSLDDPRLAACLMVCYPQYEQGLEYGFLLTSTGIWVEYSRDPYIKDSLNTTWRAFVSLKRIATRRPTNDYEPGTNGYYNLTIDGSHDASSQPVDLALQYDSLNNEVRFLVNGQVLQTIRKFGEYPDENDGFTVVYETNGDITTVPPENRTSFFCFMDNAKHTNWADPNVPHTLNSTLMGIERFVRIDRFISPRMRYWDDLGMRLNVLYGQGVKYDLYYIETAISNGTVRRPERTQNAKKYYRKNRKQHNNQQYISDDSFLSF